MPQVNLTQAMVDRLKSPPHGSPQILFWDEQTPGFGLRLTPGSKTFVAQNRIKQLTRRVSLGSASQLTVAEARQAALDHLSQSRSSSSPLDRGRPNSTQTLNSLLDTYVASYVKVRHKPNTQRNQLQIINQHIRPHLGHILLCELTRPQIIAWHTQQVPFPISANRALAHLSKTCSWAVARDFLKFNPCVGVERNKEQLSDRYLTDRELKLLFDELRKSVSVGIIDAVTVLLLTGMRVSEFLGNFHFDGDRKIIRLTDSKTGAKSISLNEQANCFLKRLDLNQPRDKYGRIYASFKRACLAVNIHGASLHTLRHTLATYMAQHGDSTFQIASMGGWKSLVHVQRYVNLHGIGTPHPMPAGERIIKAIDN